MNDIRFHVQSYRVVMISVRNCGIFHSDLTELNYGRGGLVNKTNLNSKFFKISMERVQTLTLIGKTELPTVL